MVSLRLGADPTLASSKPENICRSRCQRSQPALGLCWQSWGNTVFAALRTCTATAHTHLTLAGLCMGQRKLLSTCNTSHTPIPICSGSVRSFRASKQRGLIPSEHPLLIFSLDRRKASPSWKRHHPCGGHCFTSPHSPRRG